MLNEASVRHERWECFLRLYNESVERNVQRLTGKEKTSERCRTAKRTVFPNRINGGRETTKQWKV